jgi:serine/threonine-protein phosphatase 2A regulatory subunit A
MDDIDALALLKEEMETDEINLKVNAIHRLKTVILCIGVDETIKKVIPYLESRKFTFRLIIIIGLIDKEDDEVLFAIAEELGKVWYAHIFKTKLNRELLPDKTQLLGLLEILARADETVVREQVLHLVFNNRLGY